MGFGKRHNNTVGSASNAAADNGIYHQIRRIRRRRNTYHQSKFRLSTLHHQNSSRQQDDVQSNGHNNEQVSVLPSNAAVHHHHQQQQQLSRRFQQQQQQQQQGRRIRRHTVTATTKTTTTAQIVISNNVQRDQQEEEEEEEEESEEDQVNGTGSNKTDDVDADDKQRRNATSDESEQDEYGYGEENDQNGVVARDRATTNPQSISAPSQQGRPHHVHQNEPRGCLSPTGSPTSNAVQSISSLTGRQATKIAGVGCQKIPTRSSRADGLDSTEAGGNEEEGVEEEEDEFSDYPKIGSDYVLLTKMNLLTAENDTADNFVSTTGGSTHHQVMNLWTKELKTCQRMSSEQSDHFFKVRDRLNQPPPQHQQHQIDESRGIIEPFEAEQNDSIVSSVIPDGTEVVNHEGQFYLLTPQQFGSLHSYVQGQKRLSEDETRELYRQIVQIVAYCHSVGVVVRDLKLRKFVFADEAKTVLRMNGVSDLVVCEPGDGDEKDNDALEDRHGCPAYVSPEILDLSQKTYSGKAADIWSLGVLLFVMLLGRYPFYDSTPSGLFAKIRAGAFWILPEEDLAGRIGLECRLLLRGLLRRVPEHRPTADQLADVGWLRRHQRPRQRRRSSTSDNDDVAIQDTSSVRTTSTTSVRSPTSASASAAARSLSSRLAAEAAKRRRRQRRNGNRQTSTARTSLSDPIQSGGSSGSSTTAMFPMDEEMVVDQVVPDIPIQEQQEQQQQQPNLESDELLSSQSLDCPQQQAQVKIMISNNNNERRAVF